jgi:predicted component of type VI protein secretion system
MPLPPETLFVLFTAALMGVDADTRFMGIAAAFIGVAADGWSVMKAPSPNLTVKIYHAHLTKM